MPLAWRIEISSKAKKHLEGIDKAAAKRIIHYLRERIAQQDPKRLGEPLKGSELGSLWKYRVGNYRIIAEIEDQLFRVIVVRVGHRKDVYRK